MESSWFTIKTPVSTESIAYPVIINLAQESQVIVECRPILEDHTANAIQWIIWIICVVHCGGYVEHLQGMQQSSMSARTYIEACM